MAKNTSDEVWDENGFKDAMCMVYFKQEVKNGKLPFTPFCHYTWRGVHLDVVISSMSKVNIADLLFRCL